MKQFFIDLCFVLLLICVTHILFSDNNVSSTMFQRNIDAFEETLQTQEVTSEGRITIRDRSDNAISLVFKAISECCVSIISFFALIFSNIVSLLL